MTPTRRSIYSLPQYLVVLIAAWTMRGRTRTPLAVALLFCGVLFPALGFVNVYPFRYSFVADHFAYLATLPLIAAFAGGVVRTFDRRGVRSSHREVVAVLVLGAILGALTWRHASLFRDNETLFRETLARNPSCWLCYNNLAATRLHGSDQEAALAAQYLVEAVRLNPLSAEVQNNLGGAMQRQGRMHEALQAHRKAIELNPRLVDARYNVGVVLQALGDLDGARRQYRTRAARAARLRAGPTQPRDRSARFGSRRRRSGRVRGIIATAA